MLEYFIALIASANLAFCIFHRIEIRHHVVSLQSQINDARGRFKVDFSALKNDAERECSICHLRVCRYVPDDTGERIACANCMGEGRVDKK